MNDFSDTLKKIERVVLSSIFYESKSFEKIKAKLSSNDFFIPLHVYIFSALDKLNERNEPLTPEMVCNEINKKGITLDSIIEITAESPVADIESYVKKIKEASLERRLKKELNFHLKDSKNPLDTITRLQEFLDNVKNNHSFIQDDKNNLEWIEYFKNKQDIIHYKLGIDFLDSKVLNGGIELNQLVLISGDAESGKTTLAMQILDNISKYSKVCFFNLEFPTYKYIKRRSKALDRQFNNKEITQKIKHTMLENTIIIDSVNDIYDAQNAIIRNALKGVRFFFIDSQMCLSVPDLKGEELESKKFEILQRLTHKYDIVIFLIVQTAKGDNENPFGSKKGGHFASITIRIEHDTNKTLNERKIIIQKNKQTGIKNEFKVKLNSDLCKFYSLDSNQPIYETIELDI